RFIIAESLPVPGEPTSPNILAMRCWPSSIVLYFCDGSPARGASREIVGNPYRGGAARLHPSQCSRCWIGVTLCTTVRTTGFNVQSFIGDNPDEDETSSHHWLTEQPAFVHSSASTCDLNLPKYLGAGSLSGPRRRALDDEKRD